MRHLKLLSKCTSGLHPPRLPQQTCVIRQAKAIQYRRSHNGAAHSNTPSTASQHRDHLNHDALALWSMLIIGTSYGFYSCSQKPALCESSSFREIDIEGDPSETYANLIRYPSVKMTDREFLQHTNSVQRSGRGILRHDFFQLAANNPCEDTYWSRSLSDPDDNVIWAMWGILDGHAGPQTAEVLRDLMPPYVFRKLYARAGVWPSSLERGNEHQLHECTPETTEKAIKEAFLELDTDIMKEAIEAINGSRPLQQSLLDLSTADSGSCALLGFYNAPSQLLQVANLGDSRAVLGRRNIEGTWEAIPLSTDQTGYNADEVAKLRAEHPDEPDMIKDGRLLGMAVTRAFGDLRWKFTANLQTLARKRFFGRSLRPSLLTPPYMTAEPVITTTKINPENRDFVILASDGLWDRLSNEQAVTLVGRWLAKNDPEYIPDQPANDDEDEGMWEKSGYVKIKGREYTKMNSSDEKNWVVVDDNVGAHLARNALGGGDEDLFCGLAAPQDLLSGRARSIR
ncbi:MAG: hypothetical protein Q9220_005674 [cf. Caloplaca sp. 1 TL-2023]